MGRLGAWRACAVGHGRLRRISRSWKEEEVLFREGEYVKNKERGVKRVGGLGELFRDTQTLCPPFP